MHECYAMQILKTKKRKKKKHKQNQRTIVTKDRANEAQGPCQKDSVRSSLLHPKPFRCTMSIRVLIYMRMITNSRIGIKV